MCCFDCRPQSRPTRANDEHIVLVRLIFGHSRTASRHARYPSSRGGCKRRQTQPRKDSATPSACGRD
jgi:hypothetical protein